MIFLPRSREGGTKQQSTSAKIRSILLVSPTGLNRSFRLFNTICLISQSLQVCSVFLPASSQSVLTLVRKYGVAVPLNHCQHPPAIAPYWLSAHHLFTLQQGLPYYPRSPSILSMPGMQSRDPLSSPTAHSHRHASSQKGCNTGSSTVPGNNFLYRGYLQ